MSSGTFNIPVALPAGDSILETVRNTGDEKSRGLGSCLACERPPLWRSPFSRAVTKQYVASTDVAFFVSLAEFVFEYRSLDREKQSLSFRLHEDICA